MHWAAWTMMTVFAFGIWGVAARSVLSNLDWRVVALVTIVGYILPVLGIWVVDSPNVDGLGWLVAGKAISVGLIAQLGLFMFYQALASGGTASVVVAFTALYPVLTIVGAVLLLDESPSVMQLVGAALAMVAVALLAGGSRDTV